MTFCTPIMFISYPKKSNPQLTSSYHEYQRCEEAPFAGWRLCSLPVGNEGFQPCLQVGCWNEAMKNKVLEDGWQLWNLYVRGRVHGNIRFDAFCITVCTDCIYISMLTYLHRRIISYWIIHRKHFGKSLAIFGAGRFVDFPNETWLFAGSNLTRLEISGWYHFISFPKMAPPLVKFVCDCPPEWKYKTNVRDNRFRVILDLPRNDGQSKVEVWL